MAISNSIRVRVRVSSKVRVRVSSRVGVRVRVIRVSVSIRGGITSYDFTLHFVYDG